MHIVLFIPGFGDGGIERNFVYLANGLVQAGHRVSFLVSDPGGPFLDALDPRVSQDRLAGKSETARAERLRQWIETRQPDAVLTGQSDDHRIAARVRRQLGGSTACRFWAFIGTPLLHIIEQRYHDGLTRGWQRFKASRLLADIPHLIANSPGVAADLACLTGRPLTDIAVLPNPTIPPHLATLAAAAVSHPWLQTRDIPVIIGIGRLSRAKDFPTLIRAFARVRQVRPCRLIIAGTGRQAAKLQQLTEKLNLAEAVDLIGFVANPYAWLARASVFVLSSRWEGCPNVLIEALATGTPVVATDCISGPATVLQDGRYGRLVAVGDDAALSAAILATLDDPLPAEVLRTAARPYHIENATRAFIHLLETTHR
jgi:glycosyltransferase involved in cell wall biosynthesis